MDNFNFKITVLDTHIHFDCHGTFSKEGLIRLIETAKQATETGHTRILVDLSKLDGDLDTISRHTLGIAAAEKLTGKRIAVVSVKEKINKVAENAAVNRGADLLVTHDFDQALTWLIRFKSKLDTK